MCFNTHNLYRRRPANIISFGKRHVLLLTVAMVVTDRWRDLAHWLLNRAPPAWTQVISHQNPDSHNSPQDQKMLFHLQGAMDDRINSKKLISPHTGLQIDQFLDALASLRPMMDIN